MRWLKLCLCMLVLPIIAACGEGGGGTESKENNPLTVTPLKTVSFGVISDSHIKYDEGFGAGGYSSIPYDRLHNIGATLAPKSVQYGQLVNKLDFIMNTGDNIADLYGYFEYDSDYQYLDHWKPMQNIDNVLDNYRKALGSFYSGTPYYIALGNHDDRQYQYNLIDHTNNGRFKYYRKQAANYWFNKAVSNAYVFKLPTVGGDVTATNIEKTPNLFCYSWKQAGWLFVVLNSGADKKKDANGNDTDIYDGEFGEPRYHDEMHFGDEQLTWLESLLTANPNVPVIMFWHSPDYKFVTKNDSRAIDILNAHEDQIKVIFNGHKHVFADKSNFPGTSIPHYLTGSSTASSIYKIYYDWVLKRYVEQFVDDYDWPNYNPYYLVEATAGPDLASSTVTITNSNEIFKFKADGFIICDDINQAGCGYPPHYARIPGDS